MALGARFVFGAFEADLDSGQIRKHGIRIRLDEKAFQVLLALLERPGAVVSREDLKRRLWRDDVFVEFDKNLNNAVGRLREVLGDSAIHPHFIETLPRRGYRFITPVERTGPRDDHASESSAAPAAATATFPIVALEPPAPALAAYGRNVRWLWIAMVSLGLLALLIGLEYRLARRHASPIRSLAVLPFDAPDQSAQEYLADGMTDAVITELSKLGALNVISETSSRRYKASTKSLPIIARELGADTIVEGTVFREGDVIRITVQLIAADTDTHLWAQSYTRGVGNTLSLQSDVALAIAREIGTRITPQEETRLAAVRPIDPEAYRLYVLGNQLRQKQTKPELYEALDDFQRAVEIEPNYARAYWGIAETWIGLADWAGFILPGEGFPKAKVAAERALAIDPSLAEAHAALAFVSEVFDWNFKAADESYQRALKLSPNNAIAHWRYSLFLVRTGRNKEGIQQAQLAVQLNPLSITNIVGLGTRLFGEGRVEEGIATLRRATELDPSYYDSWLHLGEAYERAGRATDAIASGMHSVELSNHAPHAVVGLAGIYARLGRRAESEALLQALERSAFYGDAYGIAETHLTLGDTDQALRWFLTACRNHTNRMAFFQFVQGERDFDPIRRDPRFNELLRCTPAQGG